MKDILPKAYHHIIEKYKSNVLKSLMYLEDQLNLDIFYCTPKQKQRIKYLNNLKSKVQAQRKLLEAN